MEALPQAPTLRVTISDVVPAIERDFKDTFRIGRSDRCDISIKHDYVSREHVEISYKDGDWWAEDLHSSNGIFLDGKKVMRAPVGKALQIRLGVAGPVVHFVTVALAHTAAAHTSAAPGDGDRTIIERYRQHYFSNKSDEEVGEHTIFVRRAAAQVHATERRNYRWLIAALAVVLLAAGTYAWRVRHQLEEEKSSAQELFYNIKSLDLDIGNLQKIVEGSSSPAAGQAEIEKYRSRRVELEKSYDRFLATLKVYDPKLTHKQRLILRVARIFGECELDMPKDFEAEIDRYIQRWQRTDRLRSSIEKARANGYIKPITDQLLAEGLPPQFFYLALQESGFDAYASGPPTSKGIAKGMWQFIPETAVKYNLHLGPLVDLPRPDPADDRHHFDKETNAAVHYLKDLYDTDAQASGFLVMACYNWGEGRVLPLVREMPDNPRERNFWRLLAKYKDRMPQETYDYVFLIASAAVIGEDPHLFGFDFENPLQN